LVVECLGGVESQHSTQALDHQSQCSTQVLRWPAATLDTITRHKHSTTNHNARHKCFDGRPQHSTQSLDTSTRPPITMLDTSASMAGRNTRHSQAAHGTTAFPRSRTEARSFGIQAGSAMPSCVSKPKQYCTLHPRKAYCRKTRYEGGALRGLLRTHS
jgi:hypothetical protein